MSFIQPTKFGLSKIFTLQELRIKVLELLGLTMDAELTTLQNYLINQIINTLKFTIINDSISINEIELKKLKICMKNKIEFEELELNLINKLLYLNHIIEKSISKNRIEQTKLFNLNYSEIYGFNKFLDRNELIKKIKEILIKIYTK